MQDILARFILLKLRGRSSSSNKGDVMNRNHQGRNDQNRTNLGRHKLAYRQMGRGVQCPKYESFSSQYETYRFREDVDSPGWRSHFNQPEEAAGKIDHRWVDVENDTETKSYDYDRFHSGPAPVEMKTREKYRHVEVQNKRRDYHGHDLSYRARSERHPERFLGENSAVLEQQFNKPLEE